MANKKQVKFTAKDIVNAINARAAGAKVANAAIRHLRPPASPAPPRKVPANPQYGR